MDEEIKKLYKQALRFDEGELYQSVEYNAASAMRFCMELFMHRLYGDRISTMLEDYADAMDEITKLEAMHYFEQGYLAGKNSEPPQT